MRQRDRKPGALGSVLPPESLEGRVERIEARPLGTKASVLVAPAATLFHSGEVKEPVSQLVADGALAPLELLPRLGAVGHVVAEADLGRADRVEHPPCTALDPFRNHRSALRTTRARWTAAGFRSSLAKTASA